MYVKPGLFEVEQRRCAGAMAVFGVPYDGTTSYRPGARFGPTAIRQASVSLENYSPEQDMDLEDISFFDQGDLDIPLGSPSPVIGAVERAVDGLLAENLCPIMLGGEHSLTAGAVRAVARHYPEVAVVQFDAHADLREAYLGEKFSHACAMRRCTEVLSPGCLLQVGIRSGTRLEFEWMRKQGSLLAPETAVLRKRLAQLGKRRPLYVTLDLDVFDPSCVPGTGTPEPGGIDWHRFAALLACLPGESIVGADVMELAPELDPTGVSSVWAAKVLRELLLKIGSGA